MRLRSAFKSPFLGPRARRLWLISQTIPASAQVLHCGRCLSPSGDGVSTRRAWFGRAGAAILILQRSLRFRHSSQADPGCCLDWPTSPSPLPILPVRRETGIGRGLARSSSVGRRAEEKVSSRGNPYEREIAQRPG